MIDFDVNNSELTHAFQLFFDEATDAAILREYKEEVGVDLQADKLLALIENFFDLEGDSWHQYIFFSQLRDDNNVLEFFEGERQIADNEDGVYKWVDLSELDNMLIKPDCSREILCKLSQGMVNAFLCGTYCFI